MRDSVRGRPGSGLKTKSGPGGGNLGLTRVLDWVRGQTGSDLETELGPRPNWVRLGNRAGTGDRLVCLKQDLVQCEALGK